jgi:hypothetical protein
LPTSETLSNDKISYMDFAESSNDGSNVIALNTINAIPVADVELAPSAAPATTSLKRRPEWLKVRAPSGETFHAAHHLRRSQLPKYC